MVPVKLRKSAQVMNHRFSAGAVVFVPEQVAEVLIREGEATELPPGEREALRHEAGEHGRAIYAALPPTRRGCQTR